MLTPEIQDAIWADLELALPDKYAAEANGIASSTFYEWLEKGAAGEEPYVTFSAGVTIARARAVRKLTERALAGGSGCSQATWLLERRYRKDYGPQQKIELGEDPDAPLGGKRRSVDEWLDSLSIEHLRLIADAPEGSTITINPPNETAEI